MIKKDTGAAFEAATTALSQHRWAAAAQAFRDLLRTVPDHPGARRGHGTALLRLRCFGEALVEFDREIERHPHDAAAHEGRARALFQLARCAESSAAFAQAEAIGGPQPVTQAASQGEALKSFVRFVGDRPYATGAYFHLMMEELDWEGATWISRLDEKKGAGIWPIDRLIPGLSCLTMGPLEGSLEWELIRLGATRIVAVEGTRLNFLKCHVLKTAFPHLPIDFVLGDVVTTDVAPEFDAVFCQGVLYHLSEPHVLLQRVFALKPKLLFLDTQLGVDASHPASEFRALQQEGQIELAGRSYRGRLFMEGPNWYLAGLDREKPSIWLYPNELRRLLEDVGFHIEDAYVIDLGRLGVGGCYICSVPGAASSLKVRIGIVSRVKRRLYAYLAPKIPTEKLTGRSRLRG